MMNNLFSIFDPSSAYFSFNWLILPMIFLSPLLFPTSKSFSPMSVSVKKLSSEIKEAFFNKNLKPLFMFFLPFFIMIFLLNMSSLFPHIFSGTSHILMNWPMALNIWLSFLLLYLCKYPKTFIAHLVPTGTPLALMSIMVMIELISNIIRPITLSVRLTANLIAGHLLMSLLATASNKLTPLALMGFLSLLLLSLLESMVAVIQGYVFMTLITLYSSETP